MLKGVFSRAWSFGPEFFTTDRWIEVPDYRLVGLSVALIILFSIVRVTVSAANAISCGRSTVVAEVLATVITLINPHPRAAETIRIVTAIRTSCHYTPPEFVLTFFNRVNSYHNFLAVTWLACNCQKAIRRRPTWPSLAAIERQRNSRQLQGMVRNSQATQAILLQVSLGKIAYIIRVFRSQVFCQLNNQFLIGERVKFDAVGFSNFDKL